jgi:hypothetical protein
MRNTWYGGWMIIGFKKLSVGKTSWKRRAGCLQKQIGTLDVERAEAWF